MSADEHSRLAEPEKWRRIEGIFFEAIGLPPAERARFLDRACDPACRAEVEALLANDAESDDGIDTALAQEAALMLASPVVVEGSRLGPYRVLREIGRGGMGTVFLAVRDDDQYQKRVAIKVVKLGMDTRDVLRRFRHERQILAGLEHPYIARLLDGGCTTDGRPFLAMELVEGQPIDSYCREHAIGVEDRLRLFLKVCEAVSYAHRKLVVHRDLKPGNILIGGADSPQPGNPKLLDFGLAKILDPERDGGTSTGMSLAPLTPEYASPEQLAGAPLTTATDIYSLGVILYELLTGSRPYNVAAVPQADWLRTITETPIVRPSAAADARWRRRIEGDLDNIAMLALRREPERRYASVDELAGDIRAHLESRPVRARRDSLPYRSGKFVRRHRVPLLATGGILFGLVGGIVTAVEKEREAVARQQEAQRAQQLAEREHLRAERERDLALAERQVAQDRLTQMVDLSDRSLSGVYALMERLAGGMPARQEIVEATLAFLERLSKEAGDDRRLRLALAKAYSRLADIQGDPSGEKLGGRPGALQSYRAAAALLESPAAPDSRDGERLIAWLELQDKMGYLLVQMKHSATAVAAVRRAIAAIPAAATLELEHQRGNLYLTLSKATHPDLKASAPLTEISVKILESLAARNPGDAEVLYDLSRAYTERAYLAIYLTGPEASTADYDRSLGLREQLHRDRPTDLLYHRALVLAYFHAGNIQVRLRNEAAALDYYQKARALSELTAADPQNLIARGDYASALYTVALYLKSPDEDAEAIADLRKSISVYEDIAAHGAKTPDSLARAEAYGRLAARLAKAGRYAEAVPEYRGAVSAAEAYLESEDAESREAWESSLDASGALTETAALAGDRTSAQAEMRKLIERAAGFAARNFAADLVERRTGLAYLSLARTHRTLGEPEAAHAAAETAVTHAIRARDEATVREARQLMSTAADERR